MANPSTAGVHQTIACYRDALNEAVIQEAQALDIMNRAILDKVDGDKFANVAKDSIRTAEDFRLKLDNAVIDRGVILENLRLHSRSIYLFLKDMNNKERSRSRGNPMADETRRGLVYMMVRGMVSDFLENPGRDQTAIERNITLLSTMLTAAISSLFAEFAE